MATAQGSRPPSESELQDVDWQSVERTPEFQKLVKSRRRFVIPATIFFLAWYLGFILLAGYAPDFMGESVYQGLTVGYCYALTQFIMVFGLGLWYLRKSANEFDPLRRRAAEKAVHEIERTGRFDRTAAEERTEVPR